jgi:hypothetical protein
VGYLRLGAPGEGTGFGERPVRAGGRGGDDMVAGQAQPEPLGSGDEELQVAAAAEEVVGELAPHRLLLTDREALGVLVAVGEGIR